jgi:hypothetical protein
VSGSAQPEEAVNTTAKPVSAIATLALMASPRKKGVGQKSKVQGQIVISICLLTFAF